MNGTARLLIACAFAAALAGRGEPLATAAPPDAPIAAKASSAIEDGSVAPPNCWPMEDGCPARTGAAATKPLTHDLVDAWTYEAPGEIEGEPRVWGDRVVLVARLAEAKRVLLVVGLRDGLLQLKRTFDTAVSLEPSVWKNLVLLRSGPQRLEAVSLGQSMIDTKWKHDADGPVSGPILWRDEIYARAGGAILRLRMTSASPEVWRHFGVYVGKPSLCGGHVFGISYDENHGANLVMITREGGAERGTRQFLGQHLNLSQPPPDGDARVAVFPGDLVVRNAEPVGTTDGQFRSSTWFTRRFDTLVPSSLLDLEGPPVAAGEHWMAVFSNPKEGPRFESITEMTEKGYRVQVYADARRHAEFVERRIPATVLGTVVYVGARAFDWKSREIFRADLRSSKYRAVPARDTLLLAEGKLLTALRERRAKAACACVTPSGADAAAPLAIDPATAVLSDDSVREGSFVWSGPNGLLAPKDAKAGKGWPAPDVVLLLGPGATVGAGKKVLVAANAEATIHAVDVLSDRALSKAYASLAGEAATASDPALARRLAWEAQSRGAAEGDVAAAEKQADAAEKRGKAPDGAKVRALLAKERALLTKAVEGLWEATSGLPENAPETLRTRLVREVLTRDAAHPAASTWVRSRLPTGVEPPGEFRPLAWLEVVEAMRETPIHLVDPPQPGMKNLTFSQRELGSARHFWRKDVMGIESKQLLILTPLSTPARIARCLSMGELVCDTLEKIFAGGTRKRPAPEPLMLLLYESTEEYMDEGMKPLHGVPPPDPRAAEWSLGHYSPDEGLSRIWLPDGEDAFESVKSTYAHEMTHHWIEHRCPAFSEAEMRYDVATPGYWIVEGFATMIQEFRFDLATRTFESLDARAQSLDSVANATTKNLIPWKRLFSLTHVGFHTKLDKEATISLPMTWSLGLERIVSPARMFYEQAGAACHYLYEADGGKYRPALLACVLDHYTGRAKETGLAEAVGLAPDELGRRVVEWAKETISGHPPK